MPFAPGQSGNPIGRPKIGFEVRELAREHGREAVEWLAEIMRGESLSLARAACEALLDRGSGNSVQPVGIDADSVPIQGITVHFVTLPTVPSRRTAVTDDQELISTVDADSSMECWDGSPT